jgi:uncharacterized coiled-coil protein SlyX
MALANIFIKIQEIEKKLELLDGVSSVSSTPVITDMSDIYNRLSVLENNTQSQLIQQLTERIAVLEQGQQDAKIAQLDDKVTQVDDKVAQLDAKVAQLEASFLNRLNNIESVVIPDVYLRVSVLEQKMDTVI